MVRLSNVADVEFEVVEGDATNVLCEAVEKHNAEILVVGIHGYGAIKRESVISPIRLELPTMNGYAAAAAIKHISIEAQTWYIYIVMC
ncbi:hypothetical protein MUK42_34470 [Musa troglodytarum]|uniref:UspA domain-containing protein n=1 Tax=Musa troglodytarum TaxID=320322 RepID=A0A9E7HS55_9LILI|nr:hypothetical protein MUK42_34470 [Musa troglodytarum]